jgi:transposase
MEKITRTNVGLDISMDSFWATITVSNNEHEIKHLASKDFTNDQAGFKQMEQWISASGIELKELHFTMEATGVYYESIANYLYNNKYLVHVVLPNKAKKFAESLPGKSKTDKLDSKILGRLGVERKLTVWRPANPFYKELKELTRERELIVKTRTRFKNKLHALKHSYLPNKKSVARIEELIEIFDKKETEVEKDIKAKVKEDAEIKAKIEFLESIPGVGIITAAIVAAETDGFAQVVNTKQLTSYAGLDIVERESGKWKGKSKISKKGNSHIRGALYFPAMTAIRYNEEHKVFYDRIIGKKEKAKIGLTALSRKLLCLMYSLWKNNVKYEENYLQKNLQKKVNQ